MACLLSARPKGKQGQAERGAWHVVPCFGLVRWVCGAASWAAPWCTTQCDFSFFFFSFLEQPSNNFSYAVVEFSYMSSSSHKNDEFISLLYRQGKAASKLGYFRAAHVKVGSDEQFKDFLEMFKQAI